MQREVAGFGRPLRICGGAQHRRQIPRQFDSELALTWRQDNGVDEPSQRFSSLEAGFWMFQGPSQRRHLLAVQFGHLWVQERRRRVRAASFAFNSSRLARQQTTVANGQWAQISGIVDLRSCSTVVELRLYAEGPGSGDLYVDDVTVSLVP